MPGPVSDTAPSLPDRMRAFQGPEADELRDLADKMDAATAGFYGEPQTHTVQQFVGAWARARRRWCEVTGEELV
ncbi:hypothetical protein SAMN05660686_02501 [Thalassobaculum litoreum DSM 18839]|uniref:Uncharacterized protein n=1 Tax=Thalassobaculum litoreum DSM 18839 TaxID=1123362 RepID=A0A8G2BI37_9PROT|nr:hypothetical protein SAMN05660686_02501 [Thalassobaculum litoreum DSM 18839]